MSIPKTAYPLLLLAFVTMLTPGVGRAQKATSQTLLVGKVQRSFLVKVPKSSPANNRALIIALHGGGGTAASFEWTMAAFSERYGYVQFYPEGLEKTWNVPGVPTGGTFVPSVDDLAFVEALIATAIQKYRVDPQKVFLMGASRGGMMALYAMTKMPEKITGVAAIISSMPKKYENFTLRDPVALLVINGTADPLIPYQGGAPAKNKAEMMPTEALVARVVAENKAAKTPVVANLPNTNTKDGCTTQSFTYANANPAGRVVLLKVNGGGHVIPGGGQYLPAAIIGPACKDFSGIEKTYAFFDEIWR